MSTSTELTTTTTSELVTSTGVDVDRLVAAWLLDQRSENTRGAYGRDLAKLGEFLTGVGVDLLSADRGTIAAWARTLDAEGLKPSTVARRLASAASFYTYAEDEGAVDRNPVTRVKRPRLAGESTTLGLETSQLATLLETAQSAGPRDHAVICLLALNGLRASEVCQLRAEDVETVRGHCTVTVAGKGGRVDRVPLAPRTCDAIDEHLAGRTEGPLVQANDGGDLDRHKLGRIVRRLARAAGMPNPAKVTPHSLRHGFVTAALDAGVTLRDVQDAARHADPRTTRRYDRGRNALERAATYRVAAAIAEAATS